MTEEQKAALVISQAACACIEALAITNPANADELRDLVEHHAIGWNAVIGFFNGR